MPKRICIGFVVFILAKVGFGQEFAIHDNPHLPHLGDGSHTDHYFPIVDYLKKFPGSQEESVAASNAQLKMEKHNQKIEEHNRSQKKIRNDWLKPPSANLAEGEFSNLLGAIARDNRLLGAAVFNKFGLKIAETGIGFTPILIDKKLRESVVVMKSQQKFLKVSCKKFSEHKLQPIEGCRFQIALFSPVFDRSGQKDTLVGFSGALADKNYYSP